MKIIKLDIGEKTTNQGATEAGKLTAAEFNKVVSCVNSLVDNANNVMFCTQAEYNALVSAGQINDNVVYNVYDE